KIAVLVTAVLIIYYQDLAIIFDESLKSEMSNYVIVVPPVFVYLIYRKRKMLRAVISFENESAFRWSRHTPSITGILLCTASIASYWHSFYTFTPLEYHILTLPIFTAGLILILFNAQILRQAAFPVVFLAFLVPPPSEILYAIGSTLSVVSSEVSYGIIRILGVPSTLSAEYGNPAIIIVKPGGSIVFAIDIACSGIYSLIGFLVFAVFIAYITRDKLWKKIAVFLIGIPLMYALNVIRITIILLLGYYYGEQLALEVFHLMGGWTLIFLGTLLLLTLVEKLLRTDIFVRKQQIKSCEMCNPATEIKEDFCPYCGRLIKYPRIRLKKQDAAKIIAIIAIVIFLTSMQVPVFALTEGPAQIIIKTPAGEVGSTHILPEIPGYELKFIYRDRKFEQKAKQDASLIYMYMPENKSKNSIYVSVEIAQAKSSLHRWEACLITYPLSRGYQPNVEQLDLKDIQILDNPPIIARFFAFQYIKANMMQTVLYWFETSLFKTNSTVQQKYVKISLIAFPKMPEENREIEEEFTAIAKAIAGYWQPIKAWSQIAILLSQNGQILTVVTVILLAITLIYQKIEVWRERRSILRLYNKIAQQDRLILQAIYAASKERQHDLNAIILHYQELAGRVIEPKTLIEKLKELENAKLIKREIIAEDDEPISVWRNYKEFL
ncbi:MAG: exosortase/archaeosortase family protein, partial [Candidatus Bathyarchaeia archaeon]